jgi:hypothetical protein
LFAVRTRKNYNIQKFNFACGRETASLTLKKERRLRMFENRVLRRIFGPKRDEMTADRTKLHSEELHNVY